MTRTFGGTRTTMQKHLSNLKILIVDDQQDVRTLIRDILTEAGVTKIFEASDGKDAMQFIDMDFNMIDLVICDWNMPGMSGIDFLRQIRTAFPKMPFLMVTGRNDKDSVVEAKTAGVTAFIRKPFSPDELETKVKILSSRMK